MEGLFVSAVELLDAPKNLGLSDRLPSPNSWGRWGLDGSCGKFGLSKRNSVLESCSALREFCPGTPGVADSLSAFGELPNRSLRQSAVQSDHMDFQLDDQQSVGQADDIFWNSVLEEFPENEKFHGSFCVCPDCWFEISLAGNSWLNPCDSQSIWSEKQHVMKTSNCSETHCLSPSLGWEKDNAAPQSVPCDTEQETPKAPLVNVLVPSEESELYDYPTEEMPRKETVLHDLESVMAQLPTKTRICFRDALYRLADNTKRHHLAVEGQSGKLDKEKPPPWTGHNQDRSDRSDTRMVESETNIIDRAVANIMFNRMDFNNQDFTVEPPEGLEQELHGEGDLFQYHSLRNSMFPHDHQVPVFSRSHPMEESSQVA